jgi:hypothetical protein
MAGISLDNAERLSRTLSVAAIPVVLAVGGWMIQRQLQNQTVQRDYVQLALSILQNPDPSKVSPEIREWAVDLLNENSPTKLSPAAVASLKSGKATLSGFSFSPSSDLTPDLQKSLETSLGGFQKYLAALGFTGHSETISVKIAPGIVVDNYTAEYNPATRSIVVASAFAKDEPSVLRQFAHAVFLPGGPGPPGQYDYDAIESGLATYFPCSFANQPVMGEKASEAGKALLPPSDLRSRRGFGEIHLNDWGSVQNDGSQVWGGAFWRIREVMGQQDADQLIAGTWQAFSSATEGDKFKLFANALVEKARSIQGGKYFDQVQAVFRERGLQL